MLPLLVNGLMMLVMFTPMAWLADVDSFSIILCSPQYTGSVTHPQSIKDIECSRPHQKHINITQFNVTFAGINNGCGDNSQTECPWTVLPRNDPFYTRVVSDCNNKYACSIDSSHLYANEAYTACGVDSTTVRDTVIVHYVCTEEVIPVLNLTISSTTSMTSSATDDVAMSGSTGSSTSDQTTRYPSTEGSRTQSAQPTRQSVAASTIKPAMEIDVITVVIVCSVILVILVIVGVVLIIRIHKLRNIKLEIQSEAVTAL